MLGRLGRRQMEIAAAYTPSLLTFGGAAFCTMLYFTDWKVVCSKIPFYGGKFDYLKDEEEQ